MDSGGPSARLQPSGQRDRLERLAAPPRRLLLLLSALHFHGHPRLRIHCRSLHPRLLCETHPADNLSRCPKSPASSTVVSSVALLTLVMQHDSNQINVR